MKSEKVNRNELYVFNETDSAYKVIKSILLDFFLTGFQSSNYLMNGLFIPESKQEGDFVLQCLQSEFENYFARNLDKVVREIHMRAKHLARMDLKKRYFKDIEENAKIKRINEKENNRRTLTICPKCQKIILAQDLDTSQIQRYPFSFIDIHSHNGHPEHGLLIYIDAHGKCRGKGIIDFIAFSED